MKAMERTRKKEGSEERGMFTGICGEAEAISLVFLLGDGYGQDVVCLFVLRISCVFV